MKTILITIVVIAIFLVIFSGLWVALALIKAVTTKSPETGQPKKKLTGNQDTANK